MIKTRTLLAVSAALTILFSPSIFAESFKVCKYSHEEWETKADGTRINTVAFHIYHTKRVSIYSDCPEPPQPDPEVEHDFIALTEQEPGNNDISFASSHTPLNEDCTVNRTSLVVVPIYQ